MSARGSGRGRSGGGGGHGRGSPSPSPTPNTPRGHGRGGGGRGRGNGRGGYENINNNNNNNNKQSRNNNNNNSYDRDPRESPVERGRGRGRGTYNRRYGPLSPGTPQRAYQHVTRPYTPRQLGAYTIEEKWEDGKNKKQNISISSPSVSTSNPYPRKLYVTAKLDRLHVDTQQMPAIVEWINSQLAPYFVSLHVPMTHILLSIELQDNDIDSIAMSLLLPCLTELVTMKICTFQAFKLWSNAIDDIGAELLATFLTHAHAYDAPLSELHLSHNNITAKGACALLRAVYGYMYPIQITSTTTASSTKTPTSKSNALWPLWLRLEWNQIDVSELDKVTCRNISCSQRISTKQIKKREKRRAKRLAMRQAQQQLQQQHHHVDEIVSHAKLPLDDKEISLLHDDVSPHDATTQDMLNRHDIPGYESEDVGHMDESSSDSDTSSESDLDEDQLTQDMVTEEMKQLSIDGKEDEDDEEDDDEKHLQTTTTSPQTSTAETVTSSPTTLSTSTTTSTCTSPLIPICSVDSRVLCSVRRCRYGRGVAVAHVCFISLQHTPYQQSDLLQSLQGRKGKSSVSRSPNITSSTLTIPLIASTPLIPSTPILSSTSSSESPRPLVLFLDTNSVFNMIAERHVCSVWTWTSLYDRAVAGTFGTGWEDAGRHVYIALSSTVLNEMDAHKEASRRIQHGNPSIHNYQTQLAYDIKHQFGLRASDPSSSFLARCKNLGGPDKGFVKTLSVADSEMNVTLRPSALDDRRTQNDRRILNAALHWNQTIGSNGIVIVITDDANLATLASTSLPTVSAISLDHALQGYATQSWDSVLLRRVFTGLGCNLSDTPSQRYDMNVYEALRAAISILQQTLSHPQHTLMNPEQVQQSIQAWTGILSNAPSLLVSLRTSTPSKALPSPSPSPSPSSSPSACSPPPR